jgi:hypothetical protein
MPMHTFSFVLVSALILFYFASRNRSKFKFELNSKQFTNWKMVWKIEEVLTLEYYHGPKVPHRPSLALVLSSVRSPRSGPEDFHRARPVRHPTVTVASTVLKQ